MIAKALFVILSLSVAEILLPVASRAHTKGVVQQRTPPFREYDPLGVRPSELHRFVHMNMPHASPPKKICNL